MKFTKKIGLAIIAILLVAMCTAFAVSESDLLNALYRGDAAYLNKSIKKKNIKFLTTLIFLDDNVMIPLMCSSYIGHKEVVEVLLEKGADIDAKNDNGWTALMFAACKGHKEIVEVLLKNGADATIKNNDGKTAVTIASEKRYKDIEELLISSLSPEQKTAIEKEQQERKKEAEEKERQEREAKMRYRAEDFKYDVTKDGKGIIIYGVKDFLFSNNSTDSLTVIIPKTIEGFPVTKVTLNAGNEYFNNHLILGGFECPSNITYLEFKRGIVECDLNLHNCVYINLMRSKLKNTTLIIPKEWNKTYLCFYRTNIEKVIIQEGVVDLYGSNSAFYSFAKCSDLESVTFPSTLKKIYDTSFSGCWKLTEVVITDVVCKTILPEASRYLFENCESFSVATKARLRQLGYKGDF